MSKVILIIQFLQAFKRTIQIINFPFIMTEFRREMEQEGFSPEEFVERLAWRTVTSGGDFDPQVLHNTFSEAIEDLRGVLEMQRIKCAQQEAILSKDEQHLRARLMLLLHRNGSSTENLSVLEKKVSY
jgi:hypothetical protein